MGYRIFLAGASGAIGRRLTPLLRSAGHYVCGSTRSKANVDTLRSLGADPVVVDVFDASALSRAVASARPDVVIHQLTDLPKDLNPREMGAAIVRTARIRSEGTRNLVRAAIAAGARRRIVASLLKPLKDTRHEAFAFRGRALGRIPDHRRVAWSGSARASRICEIARHDEFALRSDSNRIVTRPLAPGRGLIYDRNGVLLADNVAAFRLEVTPEQVKDMDRDARGAARSRAAQRRRHRALQRAAAEQAFVSGRAAAPQTVRRGDRALRGQPLGVSGRRRGAVPDALVSARRRNSRT